jgi:hypothetical protein
VARDAKLPEAERRNLAENYAARAVVLLGQARDTGCFKNPRLLEEMKKDQNLNSLRQWPDYLKLLPTLGPKAP